MDSKRNARLLLLALAATGLSAVAFYFGAGLYPKWWLMWLAALPVLLLAPSLPWSWTLLIAFAARAFGNLAFWNYCLHDLHMPLGATLQSLLVPAAAFALAALLFRVFLRRGQVWQALLAFPSLIVGYEYVTELVFGTFGNIGYTQLNNLPVLQLAALTGMWGISFVVNLFSSAAAAAILSRSATRRRLAFGLAGVLLCVVGYGAWRLQATPPPAHSIVVGLVSTQFPSNIFPPGDSQKMRLLQQYTRQASALAARGAKIVVLPEMSVLVSGSLSDETDRLFEQTASEARIQILLGVLHVTSHLAYNEARLYSSSGRIEAVYRKRHLVPVAEARETPGHDISLLDQLDGTVGLAICRDMDYPDPAWDFDVDRWSHGHMAIMRGVEYGYSIVRSAKVGFLTVSDDRGRLLAEASTARGTVFTTLLAMVPVRHDSTLYQTFGNWFAWLNIALLCGLMTSAFLLPRKRSLNGSQPRGEVPAAAPATSAP
jgi:apolipoprotein N-acyltransferase